MRTFQPSCDHAAAAERLPMPPTEMPTVDGFHPLVILPGNETMLLCVHDEANGTAEPVEVPREFIDGVESSDAIAAHLLRLSRAVMN